MSDTSRFSWLIPTAFGGLMGLVFGAALSAAGDRPVVLPYTAGGLIAGLASSVYLRLRGA